MTFELGSHRLPSCFRVVQPIRIPIRPPVVAATGRGRREGGTGGLTPELAAGIGRAKRVTPPNRHPAVIPRPNRATGAQAARRHPGDVAARRRSGIAAPSTQHASHPSAGPRPRRSRWAVSSRGMAGRASWKAQVRQARAYRKRSTARTDSVVSFVR